MKICIITNTYSSEAIGGATIYVENISSELAKRSNEIIIITIAHNNEDAFEVKNNKKIYRFYPLNVSTFNNIAKKSFLSQGVWTILDIYNYYSYIRIKDILNKEKPDVVHLNTPVDVTLSAFDAVKSLGLPLVLTLHDYLLLCRRVVLLHGNGEICNDKNINLLCKIYRRFSRSIVNRTVDVAIAPSQFILDMYKNEGFLKDSVTALLPCCIRLEMMEGGVESVANSDKVFNVLYVGSLTRHKGVQVLIKAFIQIKNDNIRLHIVGEGVYRDNLEQIALGDNRIIFYGKINNEKMHLFYGMADILVVPSIWYEVLGIVIQEAFRVGIPIVASRIGGISEIIKDDYNGFLFNAGDVGQLKGILENIIENPDKLEELRKNTYESVREYGMSKHIQELIEIYKTAIKNNRIKELATL